MPHGRLARILRWSHRPRSRHSSGRRARLVAERVRERLRAERTDPARDPDLAAHIVRMEVRRHNDFALARGLAAVDDEAACVREVLASVAGYGPLQPYLDDPTVEELWINAPDRIFVARGGRAGAGAADAHRRAVRDLVERMLQSSGRRVDLSQPFVDASLPDGSRLHVVIPDITRRHWAVNVRKFLPAFRDLDRLVAAGSLAPSAARLLRDAMHAGRSVLVSGATHAGKTTLLGALIAACPPEHRIVTVEETFELAVGAPDLVALQGRQPSLEGTGEVTLRRLVKEALRMRPDRLVVGEVRDAEALDLLLALNTGVPGAATIHANSAREALASSRRCRCSPGATSIPRSCCLRSRHPSTSSCTANVTHPGGAEWSRSSSRPVSSAARSRPARSIGRTSHDVRVGCGAGRRAAADALAMAVARRRRGENAHDRSARPTARVGRVRARVACRGGRDRRRHRGRRRRGRVAHHAGCRPCGRGAAAGAVAPFAWLRARHSRLLRTRRALWPDVCDLLIASVRAGMSLPDAVAASPTRRRPSCGRLSPRSHAMSRHPVTSTRARCD